MTQTLPRSLEVSLGVIVARERIDNPWQEYIWKPVSVFLDAPPITEMRLLRRGPGHEHFHVATMPLELHRKETAGYKVNLSNGVPSVYVVLREGGESGVAIQCHLLTASPFDVEAYGATSEDIIGRVSMPDELVELVEAFIDAHHVEEAFVKRTRVRYEAEDEHNFGQEPVHVLRERMRLAGRDPGVT